MINISVWSNKYVEIENHIFRLENKTQFIVFLSTLIEEIKYSGEVICLESVEITNEKGMPTNIFTEVNRW